MSSCPAKPEPMYFATELLTEVFTRLPVKSLLRFRCVCKIWRNIIDDPDFICMHLSAYKNNHERNHWLVMRYRDHAELILSICHGDTYPKSVPLLTFTQPHSTYSVFMPCSSCDGLMLTKQIEPKSNELRALIVWNPSIKKSMLVPPCPFTREQGRITYALGFAPSSNEYKVIAFQYNPWLYNYVPSVAVYVLGNGFWRAKADGVDVHMPPLLNWRFVLRSGFLYSKTAAHWFALDPKYIRAFDVKCTHLISFDFDNEGFSIVELPDYGTEMVKFLFLLGESIAVLGISRVSSCIWVMEKEGGKEPWIKWFSGGSSLDSYELFNSLLDYDTIMEIVYLEKSGIFLIRSSEGTLTSYNIRSNQIHRQCIDGCYIDTYIESLVLSRGFKGQTLTSFT